MSGEIYKGTQGREGWKFEQIQKLEEHLSDKGERIYLYALFEDQSEHLWAIAEVGDESMMRSVAFPALEHENWKEWIIHQSNGLKPSIFGPDVNVPYKYAHRPHFILQDGRTDGSQNRMTWLDGMWTWFYPDLECGPQDVQSFKQRYYSITGLLVIFWGGFSIRVRRYYTKNVRDRKKDRSSRQDCYRDLSEAWKQIGAWGSFLGLVIAPFGLLLTPFVASRLDGSFIGITEWWVAAVYFVSILIVAVLQKQQLETDIGVCNTRSFLLLLFLATIEYSVLLLFSSVQIEDLLGMKQCYMGILVGDFQLYQGCMHFVIFAAIYWSLSHILVARQSREVERGGDPARSI